MKRTHEGAPTVTLSYEEKIINALSRVTHKRTDDGLTRDKRDFAAIRAVLQPLYAERDAERARLAEARALLERIAEDSSLVAPVAAINALLAKWDAADAKEKR